MRNWIFVTLHIIIGCLICHLCGYFVPTIAFIYNLVYISGTVLLYSLAILIGVLLRLWVSHKPDPPPILYKPELNEEILLRTKKKHQELKSTPEKVKTHIVSRNVDDAIDELLELLLRDYVKSWHSDLVTHPSVFCKHLKEQIRSVLLGLQNRCNKIQSVELFTHDFIVAMTEHFKNVRGAVINPAEKITEYKVFKFLSSNEAELEHLRYITEFLLATLLPKQYVKSKLLGSLLREIFVVLIFHPVISKLCDPDFINTNIISYFKQQMLQAEKLGKKYEYAETYEDFMKLIQSSSDVEMLKRLRYHLSTSIMEGITQRKVKLSKGMDADKEFVPQSLNKGEQLQARNLDRYLNQLFYAKKQCEKRLQLVGGKEFAASPRSEKGSLGSSVYMPGQKVLSMAVLMQSSFCRKQFSKFLQKEAAHSLLGFWEDVEDMKHSDKEHWHRLGNNIVEVYVKNSSSCVRLNKNTLRGIEDFLMANKGPEAFFNAQEDMYKILEEKHYASFIVSDIYHKMIAESEKKGIDFMQASSSKDISEEMEETESDGKVSDASDVSLFGHSSYARSQLKVLTEKLADKKQALAALKDNPKLESPAVQLEKEVIELIKEQNLLENHIEKTELWIQHLGVWQAMIMEAMEKKENDKVIPYFVLKVHLASDAQTCDKMVGWVVERSLNSFHGLHQKLVPAASWLKKIDLPTKPRFKTFDRNYLDKQKRTLQTFISAVTKDDGLNKSEALYDFLSPSPDYMKHPPVAAHKKPSKFLQIFKEVQTTLSAFDDSDEKDLLFLDDDGKDDKKDSVAEPLFALINEIFELKGALNWPRKQLMIFVQFSYGHSINRQIRDTVAWLVSEPMLLFYLQLFRDTMWPTGASQPETEEKTSEEKMRTKMEAKEIFLNNTMVLTKISGEDNVKKGLSKVFDALQNQTSNKHLLYKLLEAFLYKYSPELSEIAQMSSTDENFVKI